MRHQRIDAPVILNGLRAAKSYFAQCFAYSGTTQETLWIAHVDERFAVLHLSRDSGFETSVPFPLRGIIIDVLRHRSTGLLLAHNHPSGNARASESDCRVTRRLVPVVEALNCTVLDHLIFAGDEWTSFRQLGLI